MDTLSLCHNEGIDNMNETIYLDHDVGGLEEVPNLPQDILEALNKESEGSKPNLEERGDKPSQQWQERKVCQDRGKLSQRHERRVHSSVEGIQGNLYLVLSRYAKTGY